MVKLEVLIRQGARIRSALSPLRRGAGSCCRYG